MWNYNYNTELYHHGVKGMKWGVRRYQNYDGSYTQAGMKRFNSSLEKYEKSNDRYKNAKSSLRSAKKNGTYEQGMKTEVVNARMARNQSKKRLVKDYKHLKQDKLADQGKDLYSRGKRITDNNNSVNRAATATGLLATGSLYAHAAYQETGKKGYDYVSTSAAAGTLLAGSYAYAKRIKNESDNKKLRAYYGHTSVY